jgi:hypothetical protein
VYDLVGQTFERLTVLKRDHGKYWLCQCSCGETTIVAGYRLKSGHTRSCGCFRRECTTQKNLRHGLATRRGGREPEYIAWQNMKKRCLDKNSVDYKNYGGRGITVSAEWLNDYPKFRADMGAKPTPKHTLERVNNNGGYMKSNCKWATRKEQAANQRPRLMHSKQGA